MVEKLQGVEENSRRVESAITESVKECDESRNSRAMCEKAHEAGFHVARDI